MHVLNPQPPSQHSPHTLIALLSAPSTEHSIVIRSRSTMARPGSNAPVSASTVHLIVQSSPDLAIRCENYMFKVHQEEVMSKTTLLMNIQYNGFKDGIPEVQTKDIKPAVLSCILDFLYTGDFDETGKKQYVPSTVLIADAGDDNVQSPPGSPSTERHKKLASIFTLAQKYKIRKLKELVEQKFAASGKISVYLDGIIADAKLGPSGMGSKLQMKLQEAAASPTNPPSSTTFSETLDDSSGSAATGTTTPASLIKTPSEAESTGSRSYHPSEGPPTMTLEEEAALANVSSTPISEEELKAFQEEISKIKALQQEKFQAELSRDTAQGRLDGLIKTLNETKRCKNSSCRASLNVLVHEGEKMDGANSSVEPKASGSESHTKEVKEKPAVQDTPRKPVEEVHRKAASEVKQEPASKVQQEHASDVQQKPNPKPQTSVTSETQKASSEVQQKISPEGDKKPIQGIQSQEAATNKEPVISHDPVVQTDGADQKVTKLKVQTQKDDSSKVQSQAETMPCTHSKRDIPAPGDIHSDSHKQGATQPKDQNDGKQSSHGHQDAQMSNQSHTDGPHAVQDKAEGQVQTQEQGAGGVSELPESRNSNNQQRRGQQIQRRRGNQNRKRKDNRENRTENRDHKKDGRQMGSFFEKRGNWKSAYDQRGPRNQNLLTFPEAEGSGRFGMFQDIRLLENPDLPHHIYHGKGDEPSAAKEAVKQTGQNDASIAEHTDVKEAEVKMEEVGQEEHKEETSQPEVKHQEVEQAEIKKEEDKQVETRDEEVKQEESPEFEVNRDREYEDNVGLFCGPPGTGVLFMVDKQVLKEQSTWFCEQIGDKEVASFEVEEEATLVSMMVQYMHLGNFDERGAPVPGTAQELNEQLEKSTDGGAPIGLSGVAKRLTSLIEMSKKFGVPGLGKLASAKLKESIELSKSYLETLKAKLQELQGEVDCVGREIEAVEKEA
ncbi:hypothetical protein Dda_3479 [Drechslerella dactyloides]|uniref:BTB domain-containing protein n=1 Tax=Drechslerella dactyloides TaxID=74499 RepID=A0AAD6J2L9_DREDA|nr:hypothetical protein Dda_3479 [Drechslerella dactyloides]